MRYILFSLVIFFIGCSSEHTRDKTYVGGRIVNPNSSYIILEHNDDFIDTLTLDANHNFSYEFDQDDESVYSFVHYPESQSIYLQPGDSTVLRVNTLEFDESLTFGGSSSKENNFLIDMFLLNEKDNDLILSYYKISPQDFIHKTDSILSIRLEELEKLKAESNFTPYFQDLAEKTIRYEYFDMKERYAFLMKKYVPAKYKEFPEDYFNYREEVNFNDSSLVSNFSYMRFLDNYLRNKSIVVCETENRDCFDLNNHQNLKRRLNLVLELFENDHLKRNFFNRFIRREIVFSQTEEQLQETLNIIEKFDLKAIDEEELHQLIDIQSKYLIGRNLKDLKLKTPENKIVELKNISNGKPILLHTWSALSFESKKNNLGKIDDLIEKYPEIDFVSINLDFQNPQLWDNALKRFDYDLDSEFQIVSDAPHNTYGFFKNYLNRVYLVNKNYEIINNSLSLYDPKLESQVLSLLDR